MPVLCTVQAGEMARGGEGAFCPAHLAWTHCLGPFGLLELLSQNPFAR